MHILLPETNTRKHFIKKREMSWSNAIFMDAERFHNQVLAFTKSLFYAQYAISVKADCHFSLQSVLILKATITTKADDNFLFFFSEETKS